jgi:hypothetical protein
MKNNKNLVIIITTLIIATFALQACSVISAIETMEEPTTEAQIPVEQSRVEEEINAENSSELEETEETTPTDTQTNLPIVTADDRPETNSAGNELTDDEIAGLIFMREEEKLAKDVYLGLYDLWGLSIFQNIAGSEQTHTDAVKRLLDTFGIEDPADTSPTGVFANQDLQTLYDDLMALGAQSMGDALLVGGAIEEIDILDLQEYLDNTQDESIRRVYQNLLRGSENHLRAFTSNYERQTGETYLPQYMSQADYDAIVTSSSSRGGRGNRNRP